eukprot:GAHX01007297.1.p1 GENE.GAHX01007297.1~~GAHX01007297.1.p1  ORF type:complete len:54 (-),score=0.31 GAHX01007297.1:169-330(-)
MLIHAIPLTWLYIYHVIMDKICGKNVQNHIASFVNELMIQRYNEISRIERNES